MRYKAAQILYVEVDVEGKVQMSRQTRSFELLLAGNLLCNAEPQLLKEESVAYLLEYSQHWTTLLHSLTGEAYLQRIVSMPYRCI